MKALKRLSVVENSKNKVNNRITEKGSNVESGKQKFSDS